MSDTVEIVSLGHAGDGMTADGRFLPYTVPGDVVRVPTAMRGAEIVTSGPMRVTPPCAHFGHCGGCALQHVEMSVYLAWKHDLIVSALAQRGFADVAVGDIRAVPPHSRRRAMLKARKSRGAVQLGFYEPESRNLVDIRQCPILVPAIASALLKLRAALAHLLREGDGAELHITALDAGLDLSLKWKRGHSVNVLMDLGAFARDLDLVRLTWNGDIVAVARDPVLRIGTHGVLLPPEPFLQPTRQGEKILQNLVREGVAEAKSVADLFSGCGTFALSLGGAQSLYAAEDNEAMLKALDAAARKEGTRVRSEKRDLFRRPLFPVELKAFDAVIIDPPRPGAKAQAEQLAQSAVPRIVYVSCSPASFARDARLLCEGGYHIRRITPVDQFLWSPHVELVAVLERG
jgi:23S rRNA (uracil1939-C5)-methyltransferase